MKGNIPPEIKLSAEDKDAWIPSFTVPSERTETYSPTAIDKAPADIDAVATGNKLTWAADAPIIKEDTETRPSLEPRTAARNHCLIRRVYLIDEAKNL